MPDIDGLTMEELCELRSMLYDAIYLANCYPMDGIDADELELAVRMVDERIDEMCEADEAAMNREYEQGAL